MIICVHKLYQSKFDIVNKQECQETHLWIKAKDPVDRQSTFVYLDSGDLGLISSNLIVISLM